MLFWQLSILLPRKQDDIDGIEFSFGGGSWNNQHHYLLAGKRFGDFSISGYVDYRKSEGYDNYFIQQDLVTLLYSYVPFVPSASMAPGYVQVPLNSTRADVRMKYKDFELQFKAQDYERGIPLIGYSVTDGIYEADKSYIGQAIYRRKVGDKLSLSLKGHYYYRELCFYGQPFPRGMFGPLMPGVRAQSFFSDGLIFDLTYKSQNIGVQTQFDYKLSEENSLTFGIEYIDSHTDKPIAHFNVDPTTRIQSNQMHVARGTTAGVMDRAADRKVFAAFIQDNWQIAESLNLTAGLRVDHYSDFGSSVNPRLSLVWKLLEDTNIKILYGHAFRAPAFNELYNITQDVVGNENLGPEKVKSFEIGLNHKPTSEINISVNYFYNALTDIILPTGEIIIETFPPQLENSGKVNA